MRAAGQFTGPASPTTEFKIPTKQGDKYVDALLNELRQFEQEDYDSAIDRFLDLYGDDLVLYVSSKSRAIAQGLEATEEFGVWERTNTDIINQTPPTSWHPAEVASLPSPCGSASCRKANDKSSPTAR
jgi:hypothetical protein